jgi:hypothetical protein
MQRKDKILKLHTPVDVERQTTSGVPELNAMNRNFKKSKEMDIWASTE